MAIGIVPSLEGSWYDYLLLFHHDDHTDTESDDIISTLNKKQ
jgi:hypothetical protein